MEDVTTLLQNAMTADAPAQSDLAERRVAREVDRFLKRIVSDLPHDEITGRLKRRQHVIDRLKLDFPKDADTAGA